MASGALTDGAREKVVRARHILVDSEELARELLAQVAQTPVAFEQLARTLSTCPSGAAKGGDLGWIRAREITAPLDALLFPPEIASLEALSAHHAQRNPQLVQTQFGWHVVEVREVRAAVGVISMDEFVARYEKSADSRAEMQLVDVRERWELGLARLDDFLNLPMSEYEVWGDAVEARARGDAVRSPPGSDAEDAMDWNAIAALDVEKELVVMCHHGVRSAQMAAYFTQIGLRNVRNLTGGIDLYALSSDVYNSRY